MFNGTFSADGFRVVADNALDYVVGAQAAGAGHVGATVRELGRTLHTDVDALTRTVASGSAEIVAVNQAGFDQVGRSVASGFSSMKALSGANLAVSAVGFAVVAKQLHSIGGDIRQLRTDLVKQGEELVQVQRAANAKLESLVDFADRTLRTQEKILETLVSSRTVEAQQLIRQGWDNLRHGYEDDAFSRLVKSLDFDNTVYVSHSQLGEIYAKRGDHEKAEDHFKRAIAFSSSATPELQGYAHVQYARFLDERQRLDDAAAQIEAALGLFDRNEWRFYRVELLARLGRPGPALDALAELINRDSRFFVAAGASEPIAALGRPLVERLVAIDEARRAPVLDHLSTGTKVLPALEALSQVAPQALPEARVAQLRDRGAEALRAALTGPFAALSDADAAAGAFSEAISREHEATLRRVVEPLTQLAERWKAHDRQRPPQGASTPPVWRPNWMAWLASVVLIVFYGLGIIGLVFCFWRKGRADQAAALRAQEEARLPGLWTAWREAAEKILSDFACEKTRVVALLDAVVARAGDVAVEPARDHARTMALADIQPVPDRFRNESAAVPTPSVGSVTPKEGISLGRLALLIVLSVAMFIIVMNIVMSAAR